MCGSAQEGQFTIFVHKSITTGKILVILAGDQVTWLVGFSRRTQADWVVSQGVTKSGS